MERIFRYTTGFIIVSHVINAHYVTYTEVSPRFNMLDITGKTAVEILQDVATRRLQVYETRREAVESLDIDIRTLKKYTDGES